MSETNNNNLKLGLSGLILDFSSPYSWKNKLEERQLRTHAGLYQTWKLNNNWYFGEVIWTT